MKIKIEELEKLIELVRRHGIHQLEVEESGTKVSVTAQPPGAPAPSGFYAGMSPMPQAYQMAHAPSAPSAAADAGHAPSAAPPKKPVPQGKLIKSPFVGTFYRSPSPGSEVFVEVGRRVKKGDTLCIIEAMKLMNEIESESDGVIKEILADNESPVEFDQPLFLLE